MSTEKRDLFDELDRLTQESIPRGYVQESSGVREETDAEFSTRLRQAANDGMLANLRGVYPGPTRVVG